MIDIQTVIAILVAILIFGVIILVHELGHFFVAKLMGVKVNEFAIGMGPKLLKFGKKETVYTLRALPIGGYCAMEGEDEASGDPRSFGSKKVWRRVLIVLAGAVMNLVLGYALLVVYYGVYTKPSEQGGTAAYSSTIVAQLSEDAPSYQTGLRVGDKIIKINGKRTMTDFDVANLMQSDEDGVMSITVRREVDGETQTVTLPDVRFELKKNEETGKNILIYDFKVQPIKKTVGSTLAQAGKMEYSVGILIWRSLGDILTGKYGLNELSGPVGTVGAIGDVVAQVPSVGLQDLLMLVVLITVNVGIFNLLPLPALDGGRLLFLAFEGIFRRPINPKYEGMVHAIGFALLIVLMLVVTFSDIVKLVGGG